MAVMLLVATADDLAWGLPWAVCLADAFDQGILLALTVPGDRSTGDDSSEAKSEASLPCEVGKDALIQELSAANWKPKALSWKELPEQRFWLRNRDDEKRPIGILDVPARQTPLQRQLARCATDLLLVLDAPKANGESDVHAIRSALFQSASGPAVLLNPGETRGTGEVECNAVVVPLTAERAFSSAVQMARRIAGGERVPAVRWARSAARTSLVFEEPSHGQPAGPPARSIDSRRRAVADLDLEAVKADVAETPGADLILLGAGLASRTPSAYETAARKLLDAAAETPVGLARDPLSGWARWRRAASLRVQAIVPQMTRGQRTEFVQSVARESEFCFEFGALILAATLLATIGLLQDSAAVIIGAMLVAPLMTPMIGIGLAIISGNTPLSRVASRSVFLGFVIAYAAAFAFSLAWSGFSQEAIEVTGSAAHLRWSELSRRAMTPTGLDFLVGFIGGSAATFARSRGGASSALSGAVIAAALVPPIAAAAVLHCAALQAWLGGAGASFPLPVLVSPLLLFLINLQTVILGTMVCLLAVGVRSFHAHSRPKRWVVLAFVGIALLTAALYSALRSGYFGP